MWCHPGLSCRVTNVQAMPLFQRVSSILPCPWLCKPVQAPSWAKELSERSQACAAQPCHNLGKCPFTPQRPPSPDFGTRAPAAVLSHARATGEQAHTDFSKQIIAVWKWSWWARTWCINDWGTLGRSTLQCCLQKNIWRAKSEQGIFQAEQRPIWITEIAFLLSQHSKPFCSRPMAGVKAHTQTSYHVCVHKQESWAMGNFPISTQLLRDKTPGQDKLMWYGHMATRATPHTSKVFQRAELLPGVNGKPVMRNE